MDIQKSKALIPGATRPVGRAIARKLAEQGATLILPWIDDWPEDAESLQEEFGQSHSPHLLVQVDLLDGQQVVDLIAQIDSAFGSLDILINNIERGGMPVLHGSYHRRVNRKQWQLEMDTTLQAKWRLFDGCLPLLQRVDTAAVVNISSIAGLVGRSGPAAKLFNDGYAAANRGISSLTETWARLGSPDIRVNELMLGLIDSRHGENTRGWELLTEAEQQELLDHTLLGRTGKPEDVAKAVLYLVRDAAFMSGSILRLDGGYILGGDTARTMPAGFLEG
jgi:3-oxoacyl-[acyl-carrier protein] reductase